MPHDDGPPRAETLPFRSPQPAPTNLMVLHETADDGRAETTIARTWLVADAERCRLCATCSARIARTGLTALCMKKTRQFVPEERAALWRDGASFLADATDQRPGTVAG